jgi:AAA family ATP:ADP antiporter
MSLKDSVKFVASSRYIRLIAILLLCYGIAINLVEGPWKQKASTIYTDAESYSMFVGGYLKYTGILTILFVLIGSNVVRFLGWMAAAIITPIMVFSTGLIFFGVSNFPMFVDIMGFGLLNPAMLAVSVGAIQNILSKSSKYTLFDSTKEMSYVPLDEELKTKGKAAVDVIGIKLGKSISAFVQSLMLSFIPGATLASISVYLMTIFGVVCIIWLWAVVELGKEYKLAVVRNKKK